MFDNIRLWDKWVKPLLNWVSQQILYFALNDSVFRVTMSVFIVTASVILGFQQAKSETPKPGDESKIAMLGLLWQVLLQFLANYCTIVPVLREQRQLKKGSFPPSSTRQKIIRVHYHVFYLSVVCSVMATLMAPVLLHALAPRHKIASDIANFASNIFAVTAASQLAVGITKGLRDRE